MDDVKITEMKFPDEKGGISLTARSPAFAAFAAECVKLFKEDGGVNYVEWRMTSGEPGFGIFTVCIQRENGETPAQQNGRLRKELEQHKLQNDDWKLLAGSLLQRVHDLGLHQKSIQFCEEPTCKAAYTRLAQKRKCNKSKNDFGLVHPCGQDLPCPIHG